MTARTLPWAAAAVVLSGTSAPAQVRLEPDGEKSARTAFESRAHPDRLRCEFHSVPPALDYALQFRAGYAIYVPLNQPGGEGHSLDILLRVTPEGRAPVYLASSGTVPKASGNRFDAYARHAAGLHDHRRRLGTGHARPGGNSGAFGIRSRNLGVGPHR